MILVDANLLVYAHVRDFRQHEVARAWLDGQFETAVRVGMPWASLLGFLRIVTNPRIFERPAAIGAAWQQVEEWLDRDPAWIPVPTRRHREVLRSLIQQVEVRANLVPDVDLAALAIEHGVTLASSDGDFARFPALRWINPLASA